jgi:hypothetical protein
VSIRGLLIGSSARMIVVGIIAMLCVIPTLGAPAYGSEPADFAATGEEYPAKLSTTASNVTLLEDGEDSVSCGKVEFAGEITKESENLTFTPTYSECTGDIEGSKSSATVSPGSCKVELGGFTEGTEVGGEVQELTGKVSIGPSTCGAIKMEVPAASCTFEFAAQGPSSGAIVKPDEEESEEEPLEFSARLSAASVTFSKGCEKSHCPKMKLSTKTGLGVIGAVAGPIAHEAVKKVWADYEKARLSFYVGGLKVTKVKVAEGAKQLVEVRNETKWPLWVAKKKMEGNLNWVYENIATEKGEFCGNKGVVPVRYGVFFFTKCKFEVKAPKEKPTANKYKLEYLIYLRGEFEFET